MGDRDWTDWVSDNMGMVLLFIIALMAFLIFAVVAAEGKEREQFMELCQKHEPEYKCIAMWRAGEQSSTTVIPMPVVVGR